MNGEPLQPRHGFPVRSVVPGVLGARSVKWLDRITISDQESPCFYQQRDYKVLPPEAVDADAAEKFWSNTPAMLEMPVNACVAIPASSSTIVLPASGLVNVSGYAVPEGHQGPVTRVQVSGDEGETWIDAQLDDGGKYASRWAWVLWNAQVKMEKGSGRRIFAKATDAGGNTQDCARSTWNLRGVAYNGYEAVVDLTII
jgi:sulfite oxidase